MTTPDSGTGPIEQDINQAVDAGNLAPTTEIPGSGTPPAQSAQNIPQGDASAGVTPAPNAPNAPPAPNAPNAPNSRPAQGPQVQPQGPSAQPNQPQKPPSLRSRIFDTILKVGAGQPVQGPDGKPIPMTRGFMGRAILANALAGMMAGYGSEQVVMGPHGPTRINNPAAGAAAGAAAGKALQQNRQEQINDSQARAYNTVKRNLDLHATMMNAQKMDHEQQMGLLNETQPLLDGLTALDASNTDPKVPKMILERGLTADELMQKYHIAKNNAILDRWREAIDPATGKQIVKDGVPQYEPTFTAINPDAILHYNKDLRDNLAAQNPDMARIPLNAPIQAKAILGMVQNNMNMKIGQDALGRWAKKNDEISGTTTKADINDLIAKNPTVRRAIPYINKYIGEDPDVMLAGLRKEKDPTAQAAAGIIANALDINEDKWKSYREHETKRVENEESEKKSKQESEQTLQREKALADYKHQLDLSGGTKAISDQPFQFDYADKAGHHWDLTSQSAKLVDGSEDPTQMTKRAKNYDQIVKEADAYSRTRYGAPFNLAQAQIDFKEAQNPSVRSTLRYLNSLTGSGEDNHTGNPSGNLAEISKLSKSIGRTDFPALNDKAAWLRMETGDPKMAAYHTAVTEVADQIAKILQGGGAGGGTSDTKLKQAQDMLSTRFSSDQLDGVVTELRSLLGNRQKSLIQDNRYLEKQFGKYVAPPNDAVSKLTNASTGQIAYKLKNGSIVDAFGKPVQQ